MLSANMEFVFIFSIFCFHLLFQSVCVHIQDYLLAIRSDTLDMNLSEKVNQINRLDCTVVMHVYIMYDSSRAAETM